MHLLERAIQCGHLPQNTILDKEMLRELMITKISNTYIENILHDIKRFIQNPSHLQVWSKQYFYDLIKMMKVE